MRSGGARGSAPGFGSRWRGRGCLELRLLGGLLQQHTLRQDARRVPLPPPLLLVIPVSQLLLLKPARAGMGLRSLPRSSASGDRQLCHATSAAKVSSS